MTDGPKSAKGSDALGQFASRTLEWKAHDTGELLMLTSFRTYDDDRGVIVFEQAFPRDVLAHDAFSGLSAQTVFPGFFRNGSETLDCFSYHGVFPAMKTCTLGTYAESHQGGAPLTIYDSTNETLPMTVLSPLNFPKAHHMVSSADFFGSGVKATVKLIPSGWTQLFVLSAGTGKRPTARPSQAIPGATLSLERPRPGQRAHLSPSVTSDFQ